LTAAGTSAFVQLTFSIGPDR